MSRRTAIGVDVGGTKIETALVDLATGGILAREVQATPISAGRTGVTASIIDAVGRIRREADAPPLGVGIGLPELVDNDGRVSSAWNLDWSGFDAARDLKALGRVKLESDVRAAALGEIRHGHGRNRKSMAYVTIGSGLSFAFAIEGRIHRGAAGFAIHFGSSDLMPVCGACNAQTPFHLESLACGRGLARTYAGRTGRKDVDVRAIVAGEAGAEGEKLIDQATTALASYLGQIANMLDPHVMVIGGGLGTAPLFFERLRAKFPTYVWAEARKDMPLLPSALGVDTGAIGAAALIDDEAA
jgi:predicted NBD/HSP70 family sugar kinase